MQDMTGFYVDPWAGDGDLGLGNDLTMQTIFGEVGPQTDGTYNVPSASQQVNSPQNTAGYSTATPDWVKNVLTQGIGVLGQYVNTKQAIEVNRYRKIYAIKYYILAIMLAMASLWIIPTVLDGPSLIARAYAESAGPGAA